MPLDRDLDRRELFEELLTLREQVFGICLGFSHSPQDAEELAQDIYLKAFKGLDGLKQRASAREWLFRIARNTCLDHRKRAGSIRFVPLSKSGDPEDPVSTEQEVLSREQTQVFKKALARLPKRFRDVLILREYGELSYEEIALVLGMKVGTVMSRLNRARRAAAERLKEVQHE